MATSKEKRGRSNGNAAGSAKDRRARRQWLLDEFGDGERALCAVCEQVWVDFKSLFVGRIVPGHKGGTYRRGNIRPECRGCSCTEGALLAHAVMAAKRALAAVPG